RNAPRSLELAVAAGDLDSQVLAHVDLGIHSAYAGDDAAAVRYEAAMAEPVARLGSPTARAWFAYVRGERLAELGDPAAAGHLREAIGLAEEVGSDFVAGVARHTLVTTAARAGAASSAMAEFGPLIDHWHGFGAWTQLWIAVRALIETLSRWERHADVAVLVGAVGASARAPGLSGADAVRAGAVEQAARAALGPELEALIARGAALGDSGAVGLARRLARELGAMATTTR
ncbi:MAG: hypothetical protein L0I24_15790, partial [Pseudonocardia sp.]|nr:hypothetical protein [Pseudonocardia sp.]